MIQSERQLQKGLFDSAPLIPMRHKFTFLRREVPVGESKPDLVLVSVNIMPRNIWPTHVSYRHAFIMWLLRGYKQAPLSLLARKSHETARRTARLAEELADSGAIQKIGQKTYRLAPVLRQVRLDIVSVEAKLTNWRRALEQAVRYKNYSTSVVVAMPESGLPKQMNSLKKFETANVGLCGIHDAFEHEWIVMPRAQPQWTPETEYLFTSVVAAPRQTLWDRL